MLLKKTLLAATITSTLLLGACKQEAQTPGLYAVKGDVVASVNDVNITQPQLDEYIAYRAQLRQPSNNPVEELVNLEILRQAAVKAGKDKDNATRAAMSRAATDALANALVQEQIEADIPDADLQAEYDEQVAQVQAEIADKKEYNASHILLETEEEAKAVIEALKYGADFAETAKEKSTGPSAPNGGELNWATPDSYVPEFSAAMEALEVGAITEAPVKTQFGFHVIKLNETRAAEGPAIPEFEQVKPQIRNVLLQKRMKEYMDGLRDAATVEIVEAEAPADEAVEETAPEAAEAPTTEETPAS